MLPSPARSLSHSLIQECNKFGPFRGPIEGYNIYQMINNFKSEKIAKGPDICQDARFANNLYYEYSWRIHSLIPIYVH